YIFSKFDTASIPNLLNLLSNSNHKDVWPHAIAVVGLIGSVEKDAIPIPDFTDAIEKAAANQSYDDLTAIWYPAHIALANIGTDPALNYLAERTRAEFWAKQKIE